MVGGNSFTALENGFCEGGGTLVASSDFRVYFSGDCDTMPPPLSCFNECCYGGECPDVTKLLASQDLQWDHGYGHWFSLHEQIVYDIRPMMKAGKVAKDGYAQYKIKEFDHSIDNDIDDDDIFDDDVDGDAADVDNIEDADDDGNHADYLDDDS